MYFPVKSGLKIDIYPFQSRVDPKVTCVLFWSTWHIKRTSGTLLSKVGSNIGLGTAFGVICHFKRTAGPLPVTWLLQLDIKSAFRVIWHFKRTSSRFPVTRLLQNDIMSIFSVTCPFWKSCDDMLDFQVPFQ